ncbi:hypothetical protein NQ315_015608 [Exocentrus adspersus]|uniref:PBZ-type domain-containing protein n=1 Tax=Exocentrus adspersus TaxID=1586481 RepID=A0AAV8V8F4_9CUCU|nr:hypothetical protein NQ315_015608 [Exocentrus adspersus]
MSMTYLSILYLDDVNKENSHILPEGEHVIGRGVLNCRDKRVSRRHALITVGKDSATIKAVHVNPCFFKSANGGNVTILAKDTSIVLRDGDQFAFVAGPFWFKVKLFKNSNNNTLNSEKNVTTDIIHAVSSENDISTDSSKAGETNSCISSEVVTNTSTSKRGNIEDSPRDMPKRQKLTDANEDISRGITTVSDESNHPNTSTNLDVPSNIETTVETENTMQDIDSKALVNNLKTIFDEDYGGGKDTTDLQINKVSNSKSEEDNNNVEGENDIKIKIETVDGANLVETMNLTSQVLNSNIENGETSATPKEENKDSDFTNSNNNVENKEPAENIPEKDKETGNPGVSNDNQSNASCSNNNQHTDLRRERCWYGSSCYRKNPIHRADFSHVGDDDYDSDPNDNRPQCPFGGACYRKNMLHRRQYKHPNPPAPKPTGHTNKIQKPKQRPANQSGNSSSDESTNGDTGSTTTRPKRKASMKRKYTDDDASDDYDYEDPFINDATSDEFELSDDDDESDSTDWMDSQKVEEDSEDTKRLLKEAKRFTKAGRKKKK